MTKYPSTDIISSFFSCLANEERRVLLGYLYEKGSVPVPLQELARVLYSHEHPDDQSTNGSLQRTLATVHHNHLPPLEAAGLLDYDQYSGTVRLTEHPAYGDSGIIDILTSEAAVDSASRSELLRALADPQRRAILDVLSHQIQPITVENLARELDDGERATNDRRVSTDDIERVLVDLLHVHLPRLVDAGLVEHDPTEQTVAYVGHPDLCVPWMHSVLEPDFRASLTADLEFCKVETIEGREGVVSYGQYLIESAAEEVFCLCTSTDMLEAGCFTRIRDAARRDVEIYLGTRDPNVREFVRENAPAVTLWEPDADWWAGSVLDERVGRLLLADRYAVMLGTLVETSPSAPDQETAIIGVGTDNPLVVMVRQLVSPRLDRLDGGSQDVASQLPF